jgi:hypothetical protein
MEYQGKNRTAYKRSVHTKIPPFHCWDFVGIDSRKITAMDLSGNNQIF